jgi:hypothetical protein
MNGEKFIPAFTPEAIATRKTWQYRAIELCHGHQTMLGSLVVAMTGRYQKPPCFHPRGAKITREGQVIALYHDGHGWKERNLYSNVQEFTDIFRGLAESLSLSDVEEELMFEEIRKFIFKDERAVSNLDGGVNYRKGRN